MFKGCYAVFLFNSTAVNGAARISLSKMMHEEHTVIKKKHAEIPPSEHFTLKVAFCCFIDANKQNLSGPLFMSLNIVLKVH